MSFNDVKSCTVSVECKVLERNLNIYVLHIIIVIRIPRLLFRLICLLVGR